MSKLFYLPLSILFLLLSPGSKATGLTPHKFYMSVTDMEYNSESGSLEIIIQFFTDDLEKALERGRERIFLGTEKEDEATDLILEKFIRSNFRLHRDSKALNYTFLGKEASIDYTWVYLEIENFDITKNFSVENEALIDLFEEQSNLINFIKDGLSRSATLHKDQIRADF